MNKILTVIDSFTSILDDKGIEILDQPYKILYAFDGLWIAFYDAQAILWDSLDKTL